MDIKAAVTDVTGHHVNDVTRAVISINADKGAMCHIRHSRQRAGGGPPECNRISRGENMNDPFFEPLSTKKATTVAPQGCKAKLKARYIAARRWHFEAIRALDTRWQAANAKAVTAKPHERKAVWQALEDDLAPYFSGVPAETDPPP